MEVSNMIFNWKILLTKGWKGFVAGLLAQLIPILPSLTEGISLGDWGSMTVKGALVAVLVMLANFIKHKLLAEDSTNPVINAIKTVI